MSLQDESFPDHDFHKELELTLSQGRLSQFPNRRKFTTVYKTSNFITENAVVSTTTTITPPSTNTNTSASSETSSSDQQNMSTESTTERPSSEISSKTAASDPAGLVEVRTKEIVDDNKSVEHFQNNRRLKSTSYHDIHNEYTKRRYRHVESKVGQYIASIRAEEQKRRAKFHRHKSMPTSLTVAMVQGTDSAIDKRHSTTDLYKLNEFMGSDVDTEIANSEEHANGMTTSANTSSSQGGCVVSGNGSNATSRHESSDEALIGADFIDKLVYAQLVDEKEYIEMKLKEKSNENVRLKRNIDYMRIELSNCQDRLKRLSSSSNLSNHSSLMGYSYYGSGSSVDAFGRYTYLKPPQCGNITAAKSTQTDYSAAMLRTPIPASLKLDNNNSNMLRQRTNSNSSAQKLKGSTGNCLRPIYSTNTDKDFDSNFKEVSTTRPKCRKILTSSSSSSVGTSPKSSPSPSPCKKTRSSRRGTGVTVEHHRSVRYTQVALLNASDESDAVFNQNDSNRSSTAVTTSNVANRVNNKRRRQHSTSLRHRLMRLFGRCTHCDDPNQTFDGSHVEDIQMTQSPTPLLIKDSEIVRRTLR